MFKFFTFIFFLSLSSFCFAGSNEYAFPKGNLIILAPPFINKDYFLLEFGFITEKNIKSWDYKYSAYVTAALFQDALDQEGKLKAGGLGFKGGIFAPTNPWFPLLFSANIGFAKTVLHNSPFLGKVDTNSGKKDMFLLEAGLNYRIDKYFIRSTYQLSNVKYFKRHIAIMVGVDY